MSKLFNFAQPKGKWHKFTSFNLEKGGAKLYKNFVQKLLAVSLCMAMVLLGVPRGQNFVAEAADEAIPNTLFITKKDLLALCEETNVVDGKPTGLLATGKIKEDGGTDVKLRINFGRRPEAAHYYKDSSWTIDTAAAGPTTWLVAGSEKFTPEGQTAQTDGLVLYSEEPLVSAYYLRDASSKMNSKFQPTYYEDQSGWTYWVGTSTGKTAFDAGWGTYADADTDGTPDNPTNVYANHWGASNLRRVLTAIYNGSTLGDGDETADSSGFFNATEKGLMAASVIKTNDHQTGSAVAYTTTNYLYAPRLDSTTFSSPNNKRVTVGGADSLTIDMAHWGCYSWLRSPYPYYNYGVHALVALPGACVLCDGVGVGLPSLSAAFRLTLSSVLFASAANVASSGNATFTQVLNDTPMTLRLGSKPSDNAPDYPFTDEHKIDVRGAKLTYSAPAGCRLMVLATGANGNVFQHSIAIDEAVSNKAVDLLEIAGLTSGKDLVAKAWLEADIEDGGSLTYATRPVTVKPPIETAVTLANGTPQRVRVYDPHDVLPEDVEFSAEYSQTSGLSGFFNDGELGLTWHNYDLTLTSGGQSLSQLAAPVTLRFEAVKGIEAADAAVTHINELAKTNLHPTSVTDENGSVWVEITTDHFSRYILVTGRRAARILLAGIATLLILALGFTIRFIRKKKKN